MILLSENVVVFFRRTFAQSPVVYGRPPLGRYLSTDLRGNGEKRFDHSQIGEEAHAEPYEVLGIQQQHHQTSGKQRAVENAM